MKKIIVVGSACSGKTTLIAALKQLYPQFSTPTETIRTLSQNYGYSIQNGDSSLQLAALHLETLNLLNTEDMILDGTILMSQAYTTYYRDHNKCDMSDSTYRFYCDAINDLLKNNVDLIIFLRSGEFPVVDDGFRITDLDYIKEVDNITEDLIVRMGLQDKTIIPHGTVEERVEFCRPYIDKLIR